MNIRKGTIADILKVSRLWLKLVAELAPDYKPNVEWWREIAYKSMKNGIYHIFLVEDGGRILGFLDFFIYPEPSTGKLHMVGQHMYIEPERRGNCVSGKLYRESIRYAKRAGAQVRELFCFDNEKAGWMRKGYKPVRSMVRRAI